ncbi:MAG: hypothetical protein HKN29_04730, partial [Rhodothermales bacterium]|nr:hypothetical protein [Rhodothermales bacterium]
MAKRDNTAAEIPHLAEVFALAQVLAVDEDTAFSSTVDAFRAVPSGSRFELLGQMLKDIQLPPAPLQSVWQVATEFSVPPVEVAIEASAQSVVARRVAHEALRLRVTERFAGLPRGDRAVAFLLATSGLAHADLAGLFGLQPEQLEAHRTAVLESLGLPSENTTGLAALQEGLQSHIVQPGRTLRDAVRRARVPGPAKGGSASTRGRILPVVGILLLAVVSALAVSRFLGRPPAGPPPPPPAENALESAAYLLPLGDIQFPSRDPDEAHDWLERQLTWSFNMPAVNGVPILGAGFVSLIDGVQVPTLFYGSGSPELFVG